MVEEGDGLRLRDLLRFSCINAKSLWGDTPLLLIIGDQSTPLGSGILLQQREDHSTGMIELGIQLQVTELLPSALVVPVSSTGALPNSEENNPVLIGRSERADVYINHPTVSRSHAIMIPPGKTFLWRIVDVGSSGGTFLNGEKLRAEEPYHVRFMDDIVFGGLLCRLVDSESLGDLLEWLRNSGIDYV